MIKVFVALSLPQDIKSSLGLLKSGVRGVKWIPPDNLHLTIRYIGQVTEQQLQVIKEELREISVLPFKIRLKELGHFSGRSVPKVIWVGVEGPEELKELRKKVDSALMMAKVLSEKENFKPHVTIARLRGTTFESLAEYLQAGMGFYTREIEINEMCLFSSKQKKEGSVYSIEEVFPF